MPNPAGSEGSGRPGTPGRFTNLERPPLSASRVRRAVGDGALWTDLRVVEQTQSTNADVAAEARAGAPEGLIVIAEEQTGGRGRLDRSWQAPARSGLLVSVLLRPAVDPATWPLLGLLAGLAVVETVIGVAGVDAWLKWPNDVLVDERKLAGILAERVGDAVVLGIGVNVSLTETELPLPTATSLTLAGGNTDRESLLKELLRSLERRYLAWRDTNGSADTVVPAYRQRCGTINRQVSVQRPDGSVVTGLAESVDGEGRLAVREPDGAVSTFFAGDVVHLRGVG